VPSDDPAADRTMLVVNQAGGGSVMMGHGQVSGVLAMGLERAGLVADIRGMADPPRPVQLLTAPLPNWNVADAGFQTVRWHLATAVAARRLVRRALTESRADLLYLHSHVIAFALQDVMRQVPTVLSVDASVRDWYAMGAFREPHPTPGVVLWPSLASERVAFARAQLVVAWTEWARRGVLASAPTAKVVTLHPGLDLTSYRPGPRDERGPVRVLFVGGRFREKGGDDLMEAIGPLLGDQVRLDVVTPEATPSGPGVHVHRLQANDPQLISLYQQADVLCLPTYADATPWVVLEALACGTPVVATSVGGIPDIVPAHDRERLIQPGDVRALRVRLQEVVDRGRADTSLRQAARDFVSTSYDAHVQAAHLVSLLADLGRDGRRSAEA
jgi:glycosyltransferase involved in cell wall biosynthesis